MAKKPVDVTQLTISQIQKHWFEKTPMIGIHTIGVHPKVHNDEILAIFLLREYGVNFFPEVKAMGIGSITNKTTEHMPIKTRFWELLKKGVLVVGTCSGPFDEHEDGKEEHCCATLVAERLGVSKLPELRYLLCYTLFSDRNGDSFFDLSNKDKTKKLARDAAQRMLPSAVVKNMIRICPDVDHAQMQEYIRIMFEFYTVQIKAQKLFLDTNHEIRREKSFKTISSGKHILLLVFSDSKVAGPAANSEIARRGEKSTLTVVVNSKNQFVVLNNQQKKWNILPMVNYLRTLWCKKNDRAIPSMERLNAPGTIIEVPGLHYHDNAQNLYNGTTSQPDVPGIFNSIVTEEDLISAFKFCFSEEDISFEETGSKIEIETEEPQIKE